MDEDDNDKDAEFGGMLDWTFGLVLYLTKENLFEIGGYKSLGITQSHHIARQTLGITQVLSGCNLVHEPPGAHWLGCHRGNSVQTLAKNDSSASTNLIPDLESSTTLSKCVRILRILCISSCILLFFLLPRDSSCIIPISLLFFLPYSILPLFSPFFASFSILPLFSGHILSPKAPSQDAEANGATVASWYDAYPQVLMDSKRLRLKVAGGILCWQWFRFLELKTTTIWRCIFRGFFWSVGEGTSSLDMWRVTKCGSRSRRIEPFPSFP